MSKTNRFQKRFFLFFFVFCLFQQAQNEARNRSSRLFIYVFLFLFFLSFYIFFFLIHQIYPSTVCISDLHRSTNKKKNRKIRWTSTGTNNLPCYDYNQWQNIQYYIFIEYYSQKYQLILFLYPSPNLSS